TFILMSPINILGELLSKILPQNDDLYLDNIVLAEKVKNV
ncbi:MAG: methylase, partial [Nitrospira sp.]|nr:methylase [Nitrospira sp.]